MKGLVEAGTHALLSKTVSSTSIPIRLWLLTGSFEGLCRSFWAVMKNQQLVGRERQFSVGLSFVV
jgi:hypothetical protein